MDTTTLIGTTGATLILIAFIMNQMHRWKDTDLVYDFTNFTGSALLIAYALLLNSAPFLILNSVWAAVSLKDVILFLNKKRI